MTENRIRELRKSHNMSQEALGAVINTTQQAVSKMEKDICFISTDLLISMAEYFNVTTDYILGLSDIKRDLSGLNITVRRSRQSGVARATCPD